MLCAPDDAGEGIPDAFQNVLAAQCSDLQRRVQQAHENDVRNLQGQVSALTAETLRLRRVISQGACDKFGGTGECSSLLPTVHEPPPPVVSWQCVATTDRHRSDDDDLPPLSGYPKMRRLSSSLLEVIRPAPGMPDDMELRSDESRRESRSDDSSKEVGLVDPPTPGKFHRLAPIDSCQEVPSPRRSALKEQLTPPLPLGKAPRIQPALEDGDSTPRSQTAAARRRMQICDDVETRYLDEAKPGSAIDRSRSSTSSQDESAILYEIHDCWIVPAAEDKRSTFRRSTVMNTLTKLIKMPKGARKRASRTSTSSHLNPQMNRGYSEGLSSNSSALLVRAQNLLHDFMVKYVVIEPYSARHLSWELFTFLMVLWEVLFTPWNEAFEPKPSEAPSLGILVWCTRVIWTFDILVSAITGYMDDDGHIVMSPLMSMRYYMKRQMVLDVIVVAADWIEAMASDQSVLRLMKGWKIFRLVKVLRLKKARNISQHLFEEVRSEKLVVVANIFKIIGLMLVMAHLIACLWFHVGCGVNGWVKNGGFDQRSLQDKYMVAFHWAISIFFGEHVLLPTNPKEQAFVACTLAFTFIISIWFVSSITTSMTHLEIISTRRAQQFSMLGRYMSNNGISREVAMKVTKNAMHAVEEQDKNTPESSVELLKLISQPLLMDLHFEIHHPLLCVHPFFRCYCEINPDALRKMCHSSVTWLMLSKDDFVFQAATKPAPHEQKVLFVTKGKLEYTRQGADREKGLETLIVDTKHWISEALLWVDGWMHCGLLRAAELCKLLALDVQEFQTFLCSFATDHGKGYAQAFVRDLNESQTVSDIGCYHDATVGSIMEEVFPVEWELFKWEYMKKQVKAQQSDLEGRTSRVTTNSVVSSSRCVSPVARQLSGKLKGTTNSVNGRPRRSVGDRPSAQSLQQVQVTSHGSFLSMDVDPSIQEVQRTHSSNASIVPLMPA